MQNAKVYSHLRQIAYFCYNLIFHGALPSHIRVSVCNLYHNFVMPIEMQIPSSLFFESIFLLFEIPQSFATHSTYGTRFWKAFFFFGASGVTVNDHNFGQRMPAQQQQI